MAEQHEEHFEIIDRNKARLHLKNKKNETVVTTVEKWLDSQIEECDEICIQTRDRRVVKEEFGRKFRDLKNKIELILNGDLE